MKKMVFIILMATLLLGSCSSLTNKEVLFEDPIFERYIRSYLGKSPEDKISAKELSNMTALVIDRRFAELGVSETFHTVITRLKMDLTDLKHFPNLQKLEIQNVNGDIFYSIDAIGNCTKLSELSINYDFVGNSTVNPQSMSFYSNAYGLKTLYRILDKLPKLESLELGNVVSTNVIEEIKGKYPNMSVAMATKESLSSSFKNVDNILTKVSELDQLSKDTTIINMYLEADEDANLAVQKASTFEKLSVLRICTDKGNAEYDLMPFKNHPSLEELVLFDHSFVTNTLVSIKNNKALSAIPKLRFLTAGGVSIADTELSQLDQLKSLTLYNCGIDGFKFLSSCTDLYQLHITGGYLIGDDEIDMIEAFTYGMLKQKKLQYLTSSFTTGPILSYCPEVIENMKELRDFTTIESDSEEGYFGIFNFENNTKLKRIVFSNIQKYEKYDLEIFRGLKNLEMLWLTGSESYRNVEVLSELENLQSFVCERSGTESLEDMVDVLVQLPNISSVIFQSFIIGTVDEDIAGSLYEAGIYDVNYGARDWMDGLSE